MGYISIKEFQSWKGPFWPSSENSPFPSCSKDPKGLREINDLPKPAAH